MELQDSFQLNATGIIAKRKREPSDYRDFYQSPSVRSKRKRKDIADYTTCSAQQQSIYQQNAFFSQLLRLPAEIRNEIYSHALSDQVIHISVRECPKLDQGSYTHADYYHQHKARARNNDEEKNSFLKFTHTICTLAAETEDGNLTLFTSFLELNHSITVADAYTLTKARNKNGKAPASKEDDYRARHKPCYHAIARLKGNWVRDDSVVTVSPWFKPVTTPRLATHFLQTCRQIYSEARDLIYTSNTFAFHEGHTLELFLSKCLLPTQRSMITRLQIDGWMSDNYDPGFSTQAATLRQLTGLKSVNVAVTNAHTYYRSLGQRHCPRHALLEGTLVRLHHQEHYLARQDQDVVKVTVDQAENGWCDASEVETLVKRNVETALGYHERCCAQEENGNGGHSPFGLWS